MRVQQLMTTPVVTCHPTDSLNHAARLMWEHDCGAIPVVSETGSLVGIITDRDVAMAAYTQGCSLRASTVASAMSKLVHSVRSDASLDTVEDLMRSKQVRRIPVVDDEETPIGLISVNDLARHANHGKHTASIDRKIVEMIAGICEPGTRMLTKREPSSVRLTA